MQDRDVMGKSPEMAQGLTLLAHRVVVLTPLWALLLWGFRGSWVLRPFRLRDVFNPQLPPGFRWRIGLIALTSTIPMGGLVIPLWIRWLRRMGYEPALSRLQSPPLETPTAVPVMAAPSVQGE